MARRRIVMIGGIAAAVLALVVAAWLADRWASRGRVVGRVVVGETDVSHLPASEARRVLLAAAERLRLVPLDVAVGDRRFRVVPADIGARIDVEAALADALAAGRDGWVPGQLWTWAASVAGSRRAIGWRVSFDGDRLAAAEAGWTEALGQPGREAGLRFVDATVEAVYPADGAEVDPATTAPSLAAAVARLADRDVVLTLRTRASPVTAARVDEAAARARSYVAAPLDLAVGPLTTTLAPADVARLLTASVDGDRLDVTVPPALVGPVLRGRLPDAERAPLDAVFTSVTSTVEIVPSSDGQQIDTTATAAVVLAALERSPPRRADVAVRTVRPARTTADAEALHIRAKVAEFSTAHPGGAPRVENIHRIADAMNGVVVGPGQSFSLNRFVGPRTKEKGYLEAPVIYDAEYTADVGGGVSQFSTTLYNALYFGGYEIDEATPHAFYISRYPPGREATLSYPDPDLVFTNDSDSGLYVKTTYTDTSITVELFGDNGGRTVETLAGEPYAIVHPKTVYRPDAAVAPGDTSRQQAGADGFTIDVTRTIHWPDGHQTSTTRTTVYEAPDEIILYNPASGPPPG